MKAMLQETALRSLKTLLSKGQVFTDRASLLSYEVDAGLDRGLPEGVVFPRTVEDVVRIVRWSIEHRVPLIARGAGTGLSGGAVADRGGIIVEFSQMNHILDVDAYGRSVVVEPCVINLALDERVKAQGLYFPPDPASQRASTIGGNVAENSGGPHCFKYGVTTNYVTGLDVVLADGRHIRVGGRALDYPEYDLCGLITGSEGMLALIASISLHLVRNPPGVKTLLAIFDSVEQAAIAVSAVIAVGLVPATMELMDQQIIRLVEPFAHAGLPLDAGAILIIEVDGYPESLDAQMDEMVRLLQSHGGYGIRVAGNEEERAKIWLARKSIAGTTRHYTVDITVPRSRLAEMLAEVNRICDHLHVHVANLAHAGDGNLHPLLFIPKQMDAEQWERIYAAGWEMVKYCVSIDGSLTGEHGVGIEKRQHMSLMHTTAELMALWDVKQVFDPEHILNPGKLFPIPSQQGTESFADYTSSAASTMTQGNMPETGEVWMPETAAEAALGLIALSKAGRRVRIGGSVVGVGMVGVTVSCMMPANLTSTRGGSAFVLNGGTDDGGTFLSTARLQGVKAYAPDDLYITVGAGTPLAEIQSFLAKDRKQIPLVSPWPNATVGGLAAANINAPLRMRYGSMRDLILCATAALADGRIIRLGRPLVKNVAGFDLTKLFVGSHGSLGLLTDVTLKLIVQPRVKRTLLISIEDMRYGLIWTRQIVPLALVASAIVLCKGYAREGTPASPYLLAYTAEGIAEDVQAELDQVRQTLRTAGAPEPVEIDALSGTDLWNEMLSTTAGTALQVRIGVAPRDLPAYMQNQSAILNRGTFIADIASGCLYAIRPGEDADEANAWLEALRKPALANQGYAVVMDMPATLQGKIEPWGYQPESIDVMRRLKARWDPSGVFHAGLFAAGM
jgi:glycolate oxidase subunit GlcD